jgi:hypothetical protein
MCVHKVHRSQQQSRHRTDRTPEAFAHRTSPRVVIAAGAFDRRWLLPCHAGPHCVGLGVDPMSC